MMGNYRLPRRVAERQLSDALRWDDPEAEQDRETIADATDLIRRFYRRAHAAGWDTPEMLDARAFLRRHGYQLEVW